MPTKDDHFEIGVQHSAAGLPRYKFQDPALQERYNRGYDLGISVGGDDDVKGLPGKVDPILAHWRSLRGGKWA